jgi:hypothetical protein
VSLPIVSMQLPAQQLVVPHVVPQPPQLFGSLVMSTHELLQHVLCTPRHWPPQFVEPLSCCGGVPESCCGGVPESCFGVPESVFGVPESVFVPESVDESPTVPVAQPANNTQNHAAVPTTRMTPSPA